MLSLCRLLGVGGRGGAEREPRARGRERDGAAVQESARRGEDVPRSRELFLVVTVIKKNDR